MTNNIEFEKWSYSAESSRFVPKRSSGKVVYRSAAMPQRSQPTPEKPGDRKTIAQPPLPPPPNPKYQQSSSLQQSPIQTEEAPGVSPTVADTPTSYDIHTEGPLTYFSYYFEDGGNASPQPDDAQASRSKLPLGFIGAGAVAATVVSGLVIGDALKPTDAPKNNQPTSSTNQQDSAKNLPRPASASPEQLNTERSLPQAKPQSTTKPSSKPAPGKTSSLRQVQQLQNLPAPVPIAMPETLVSSQPVVPKQSNTRLPNVPVRNQAALPNVNIPRMSVQEAASRQAALSSIAQPETLPTDNQPSVEQSVSVTPIPTEATPNSTALPPFASSPDRFDTDQNNLIPNAPAIEQAPVSPPQDQASNSQGNNADRETINRETQSSVAAIASPQTSSQPAGQTSGQPEAIKDYITLPQTASTKAVTLMPLSEQAAAEASNEGQIGQFTVRQVNPQDYQKEWVASNKTVEDPAIALAYPAYGFIDYQRQLIVVLQDKPQNAPMQSQRLTSPSS
uniref:Uncharacterized protein n=1 Tax=Oscillatoriales cyanobacterium SpSt-402 TaxID=2282168 RepID=A0A832H3G6_9CYAN